MFVNFIRLGVACLVAAVGFSLPGDLQACVPDATPMAKAPNFVHPAPGMVMAVFGPRFHPLLNMKKHHDGIDYLAKVGDPIIAAASGEVAFAGHQGPFGIAIEIRHDGGWSTFYAHLSRPSVRAGDCVTAGDVIGASGNTGFSTGPHLHLEIRHNGTHVDPETLLDIAGRKCVLDCPSDPNKPCVCEPAK